MTRAATVLWAVLLLLGSAGTAPRRGRALSLSAFAAWTVPEEAEQSHGEGRERIYHWINFLLLATALIYLGRKPLGAFFAQRSAAVRKALDEGRKALESSQAQLRAVEAKLNHLEEEIAALKASAVSEMESERRRLRETAAAEAEKIQESARVQMELALRAAKVELRIQAAQQAVELAQEMIRARLDDAGRRRVFSRFIAGLETGKRRN